MGLTELSKRGVTAQLADSALDVYARTLFESSLLAEFHKSRPAAVRALNSVVYAEFPWNEVLPWSIIAFPEGFNSTDTDISGVEELIRLKCWFIWPESSYFKNPGDATTASLDHAHRIAIMGGADIGNTNHLGNDKLVWRNSWTTAPPAGWLPGVEQATASGIRQGPMATNYMRDSVNLAEIGPCIANVLECSTTFGVIRAC